MAGTGAEPAAPEPEAFRGPGPNTEEELEGGTRAGRTVGQAADEFLASKGIADPVIRQQIIDAGLRTDLLDPVTTPKTLVRFTKLFAKTVNAGKAFSGRLGNINTRVDTINQAAKLELAGLTPKFEFGVDIGSGQRRYVDLVGQDQATGRLVEVYQFVKRDATGMLTRSDESVAAQQIEKALSLPRGTVKLINTARRSDDK